MAIHVLVTKANVIDFEHAGLRARVEARLQQPVIEYRPLSFVEHSGFSETVREEIAMVLANHSPGEPPIRTFDAFVKGMGLAPNWNRGLELLARRKTGLRLINGGKALCRTQH